ncbi:BolA family protein [Chelatococcus reniformis]|uniref:BolA family transcriptional regulator n=1 Tax=Chelatococcus reniformis TaxID=1494448 RepID=A0A916UN50_9HYPH|nr:BolA family protein [Chelatococcus reniformis]GGC78794.1 BolA family transcriptional regulator [Chelatococcus reniformis]
MSRKDLIDGRLRAAFAPVHLAVTDDSHRHAGHRGARPEGETHFSVEIVSDAFAGKSRLERHRMVNAALADELVPERIHALAIIAKSPVEWTASA